MAFPYCGPQFNVEVPDGVAGFVVVVVEMVDVLLVVVVIVVVELDCVPQDPYAA